MLGFKTWRKLGGISSSYFCCFTFGITLIFNVSFGSGFFYIGSQMLGKHCYWDISRDAGSRILSGPPAIVPEVMAYKSRSEATGDVLSSLLSANSVHSLSRVTQGEEMPGHWFSPEQSHSFPGSLPRTSREKAGTKKQYTFLKGRLLVCIKWWHLLMAQGNNRGHRWDALRDAYLKELTPPKFQSWDSE